MIRSILPGVGAAQPPALRLLRLADSLDPDWIEVGASGLVSASSQDADGWISLDLENLAPTGSQSYRRWPVLAADGSALDPESMPDAVAVYVVIERDTVGWPGSAAAEAVAVALADQDGDASDPGTVTASVGMRTPAASTDYTLRATRGFAAEESTGTPDSYAAGCLVTTSTQIVGSIAEARQAGDGALVGGALAFEPGATSGPRRIVVAVACVSDTDTGPHPVRFRVWYAPLRLSGLPW